MLDGTTIMSYGLEFAPALIAILAAALAAWIVLRLIRRILRLFSHRPKEVAVPLHQDAPQERREPVLGSPAVPAPGPQVPDAADILALKASIDALTRQIASLEKKLVPPHGSADVAPIVRNEAAPPASVKPPLAS